MSNPSLKELSSADLLAATHALVRKSCGVEADLLLHLAEIDARKLYLERPSPSMFAFCVDELGFSDDAAYYRITVARAAQRFPILIDAVRSGQIHLAGLRVLVPHLTEENHLSVLAEAVGRTKREIDEIAARLSPRPPVAAMVRKVAQTGPIFSTTSIRDAAFALPPQPGPAAAGSSVEAGMAPAEQTDFSAASALLPRSAANRAIVAPLSPDTYKVQFTSSKAFKEKLRRAQDLLRHRIPDGNIATVMETALDLLIEQVTKERFAVGRKPRSKPAAPAAPADDAPPAESDAPKPPPELVVSRHIPDAIKRAVYERDGGRCTFADHQGNRCPETGGLEFDHMDGFAVTGKHDVDRIRLLCRPHNQYEAERRYGRAFMDWVRGEGKAAPTRPGASCAAGPNDSGEWSKAPPSA